VRGLQRGDKATEMGNRMRKQQQEMDDFFKQHSNDPSVMRNEATLRYVWEMMNRLNGRLPTAEDAAGLPDVIGADGVASPAPPMRVLHIDDSNRVVRVDEIKGKPKK
jgi:hypothetical protein